MKEYIPKREMPFSISLKSLSNEEQLFFTSYGLKAVGTIETLRGICTEQGYNPLNFKINNNIKTLSFCI